MTPNNCACGNSVSVEAGEHGGMFIRCDLCHNTVVSLSSDLDTFVAEWNQSVEDSKSSWMALVDRMKDWHNE